MQTGLWKVKSGLDIRICDMDNNHLVHTILFLERMALKRDFNKWETAVRPIYWCMLEEIEDRLDTGRIGGVHIINNKLQTEFRKEEKK
jgi:hypothetical protein